MSSGQAAVLLPTAAATVQHEVPVGAHAAAAAVQAGAEAAMEERGAASLISALAHREVPLDLVPVLRLSTANERKAPTFDDCSTDVRGRGEGRGEG